MATAEGGEDASGVPLTSATGRFSVTQRFGTSVPRQGLSPAALRAFLKRHEGKTFQPSAAEKADAKVAPVALRFEDLATFQVVERIIKPDTEQSAGSYAELLLQQARGRRCAPDAKAAAVFTPRAGRRSPRHHLTPTQDARDELGRPHVGQATVFVSHAWAYSFADLCAALLARFDPPRGGDADGATADAEATTPFLWLGACARACSC